MELDGKFLIIDLSLCFECKEPMMEMHHVVPKSRNGNKVIPLCSSCHGKAHGMKKRITSGDLIKEGMERAKSDGKHIGRKKGSGETNKEFLNKHIDIIDGLKNGLSVRVTVLSVGKSLGTVAKVRKLIKSELDG